MRGRVAARGILLAGIALQMLLAAAQVPTNTTTSWQLAGLGGTRAPGYGQNPYILQRANLLAMAGEAAMAVVNGSTLSTSTNLPSSFIATSPNNSATPGQKNAAGLLVYTPATSTIDGDDFNSFFQIAYANGSVKGVVLTAGIYTINNTMPSFHLNLYCFNRPTGVPFELDFTGSTIYFGNYQLGGIGFFFCQNLYFHGPFNFMYAAAALPFSQAVINSITNTNDGNALYNVTIDAGYPTTTTGLGDGQGHLMAAYTSAGKLVQNATDIYSAPATQLSYPPRTYVFSANYEPYVVRGNKLAIRGNAGNHGIFFYKSVNLTARYLYVYTAPIFGIFDTYGQNTTISNNIIQPWPYKIGNTLPLLSTNADGIHVTGGRNVGPTIVSNQVINSGDDAIAVHGNYYTVYTVNPSTQTLLIFSPTCNNGFCQYFFPGDLVTVYSSPGSGSTALPSAFTSLGSATIAAITLLNTDPNNHPPYPAPGDGNSVYPLQNYMSGYYYNVSFTSFPSGFAQATKDALITNVNSNGNNFSVLSNYITNHRARSIHVKASNGLISNNVIQNPGIFGFLLTPDLYFLEGDFVQNVTISNNYVSAFYGNLFQVAQNPVDGSVIIQENTKNVTYSGNTFDNAAEWAAALSSAQTLAFKGNLIRNAGCTIAFGLYEPFIPAGTLVYLGQITNASVTGNSFVTTNGCNTKGGNYAAPYYASNVTFG